MACSEAPTAIFVFVLLRVTSATANPATAAIAIGLGLAVVHLAGIPVTGTSVNPARAASGRPWWWAARR